MRRLPRHIAPLAAMLLIAAGIAGADLFAAGDKAPATMLYFFSPSCHRCTQARANVMPAVENHFSARLRVEYLDITEVDNYKKLFTLKQRLSADGKSVFPVLYFRGRFLDGRDDSNLTYEGIASFVANGMGREEGLPAVSATNADIERHFHNLAPLAIMAAGLVDGINPCAFTVIVFFMSFLFFQGYRRQSIAAVGMSFIVAVFITYLLLGIGFFAWLQAMQAFSVITKIIAYAIGGLSIVFGILSLYDAFVFLKKGESDGMVLHLPKGIKMKIQSVIGNQYRMSKDGQGRSTSLIALIGGALAVGFIISIFESVCTGQLYVPTIVFVLKTSAYKLRAFIYLFLYNLMFILPLLAIYGLALAGVSSQSFAGAMKKYMFLIKIGLAAMFIFLGVSLVHADNTIARAGMTKEDIRKDPNFHDFGTVKEGDVIKHAFKFRNTGTEVVHIEEVNTSCACTTPRVSSPTVKPGEEITIELSFDTKGYPGLRKRQLFVHTDSKKQALVIFEIQADVR